MCARSYRQKIDVFTNCLERIFHPKAGEGGEIYLYNQEEVSNIEKILLTSPNELQTEIKNISMSYF